MATTKARFTIQSKVSILGYEPGQIVVVDAEPTYVKGLAKANYIVILEEPKPKAAPPAPEKVEEDADESEES